MRLMFGLILVLAGIGGAAVISRLLSRLTRDAGVEGWLRALRVVAMVLIPIGALMIISSGVRMIGPGQVGVALLFGKVQPIALHEGINLVNPLYDVAEMNTRVQKHQARYDAAYEKAIEAKQIEEQKAEQKRYELIQAQRQAEIAAAQAKGQGDAARERAKGEAEAIRIKGEAESSYNQKVAASLTPTLIQQQYLSKWDGKLPQFSAGGQTPGMLLNIPMPSTTRP